MSDVMLRPPPQTAPQCLGHLLDTVLGRGVCPEPVRDLRVSAICHDSRAVTPGALFIAAAGTSAHGARFVADAVNRGAVAILADESAPVEAIVPVIRVTDARSMISRVAAVFYGLADIQSRGGLACIGITGTNGKSTTAYMIRAMLSACGRPTALFGTIEYDLISRRMPAPLTTPDPVSLVRHLVDAHAVGANHAVMEVSSHSLDQARVSGLRFAAALFTNLTQDHLDYHGTMETYRRAKQRLFDALDAGAAAVINADDPAGRTMLADCRGRAISFGLSQSADVSARILDESRAGTRFSARWPDGEWEFATPLVGRHNVYNAMGALAACRALDCPPDRLATALAGLTHVPGRLQRVDAAALGFDVYVDYAHTDDALRNVLTALRPTTNGRLWCVFGCGGDRDRTKRPRMARAVAEGADAFIITSDNPRTEDPIAIIRDIEAGLTPAERGQARTEPDRARAIEMAVQQLAAGDTLLIAGKGHEDYQILGTTKIHFDDVEVARRAISGRLQG